MKTQRTTHTPFSRLAQRMLHALVVAGLALSVGCASALPEGQLAAYESFREPITAFSRNAVVCFPTSLGNAAGGLAGAPLALAIYPFVWPATLFTDDDDYLFQVYGTTFWTPVLAMGGMTGGLFYPLSLLLDEDECNFGAEPSPVE